MTTVRHLLDRKGRALFSIEPEEPVLEAIRMMAEHHVGALLVMRGARARRHRVGARLRPQSGAARPLLSRHAGVADHELARRHRLARHLRSGLHAAHDRAPHPPSSRGRDGRVVGMISIGDLVKAVIEEQQQTIEQLESYIHS